MTVSEQVIQIINVLCEKFGIVVDWSSENVIPYLEILSEKLIAYEVYTSIFWIVVCLILSIGSFVATKKLYPIFKAGCEKSSKYDDIYYDLFSWGTASAFAVLGLIGLYTTIACCLTTQITDIIKCTTFPEMYIFEYISKLAGIGG